ncbi:unnamed protein product [Clonostachys chloroleuca]|uniref:Allergen Asp f 4 n=1 Tax=Clonostachys chloroleuca TaxID=1926264 RepID=A0AA35LZM4_9HYPO|nr:unnamed protein product [Clonostachys chloroleuca]
MKFSASTVLLAAALGVSAHPHGAVHNHVHRDTNLEVRDQFVKNVKPTSTVFKTVTVPAVNALAAPTSSSSAAVAIAATSSKAATTTSASSGTVGSSGSYTDDFCTGASKRGSVADNAYSGNTGSTTYGCNLKFVEESAAKNYQYITVLENAASEKQVCACFLKTGPDGKSFTGFWKGNQVLDFELAPGAKKYLAVQAATIGGCSCGVGALPYTSFGQISGVWLEFEYGSSNNPNFSGADASSLVPEKYGQTFQGLTITSETPELVQGYEKKSIIFPNGDGCNAFPKGTAENDGHGFNLANTAKGGDAIRLHAKWGTTGTLAADCPDVTEGGKPWRQVRG